eukprot:scaffold276506_cov32-Tisochrysis_lutea.AAC.3
MGLSSAHGQASSIVRNDVRAEVGTGAAHVSGAADNGAKNRRSPSVSAARRSGPRSDAPPVSLALSIEPACGRGRRPSCFSFSATMKACAARAQLGTRIHTSTIVEGIRADVWGSIKRLALMVNVKGGSVRPSTTTISPGTSPSKRSASPARAHRTTLGTSCKMYMAGKPRSPATLVGADCDGAVHHTAWCSLAKASTAEPMQHQKWCSVSDHRFAPPAFETPPPKGIM